MRDFRVRCGGTFAFALIFLSALPIPVEATSWTLRESVAARSAGPTKGPGFFEVETANPRLSGEVRFAPGGRDLTFVVRRDGRVAWEKPAPSQWILIADDADLVIMVGQARGEGVSHDGPVVFEGIAAYDADGLLVAEIDETGPILSLELLPDGRVLLMNPGHIRLVDLLRGGVTLWSAPADVDVLELLDGGRYFRTGTWEPEPATYRAALHEVASGDLLTEATRPFAENPKYFDVSTDQRYAFLRTTSSEGPLRCNVEMFEIGRWSQPVARFEALAGGPFAADRRDDGTVAVGFLRPAADTDDIEVGVDVWDAPAEEPFEHVFAPGRFDWDRSYVRFEGPELRLRYHETLHLFTQVADR